MRHRLSFVVAAAVGLITVCLVAAQQVPGQKAAPQADLQPGAVPGAGPGLAAAPRWQVIALRNDTYAPAILIDTATGDTWAMNAGNGWTSMKR